MIRPRYEYGKYTDTWNVHMHRNPKNTRNTDDSLGSGTKLLLPSWLFGFSTQGERDTISTMLTVPSNPSTRSTLPRSNWPGLAEARKSTRFSQVQILTLFFQKSPQILSPSLPAMTSFTSPVLFPIRGFYYDICDCHILPTQVWTPALNACLYSWTKPYSSKTN